MIRYLIGDTVRERALFDDREIEYQLTLTANHGIAGAELLETKARQFAREADVRVGDVSKALGKVSENLFKAAKELRCQTLKRAKPFFGGLTKSGKRELASDDDAVQPQFPLGITDNPSTVQLNRDINYLWGLLGGQL
jgi:hypothetical protein